MSKYSSYILFLLITILVTLLYINDFGPMAGLQRSVDDFLCNVTASETTRPNVVLVKIDDRAQERFGRWPWGHDLIADLLAATAGGDPKAMAVSFQLNEDTRQDSAGHTDILAGQLSWMKNVVLPYDIALGTFRSNRTNNPAHLFNNAVTVDKPLGLMDEQSSPQVRKVFLPAEKILDNDPYLGFLYSMPDDDRVLRHQALVMNYEGYYYPSLALMAAATYNGVPADQIKVIEGRKIVLGDKMDIPINDRSEYFMNFPKGQAFTTYSAADVLGEGFSQTSFKNKMVLVCVDDPAVTESFRSPVSAETPDYLVHATVIENLINRSTVAVESRRHGLNLLILFLVGGLCAYFLPQMSLVHRMVVLFGAFFLLANVNYFLVSSFRIIAQTVYLALELALFMAASPLLETSFIVGPDKAGKSARKRALPKADAGLAGASGSQGIPVHTIQASAGDADNVETEVFKQPAGAFRDYQAISLGSDENKQSSASDSGAQPSTSALTSTGVSDSSRVGGETFSRGADSSGPEIIQPDGSAMTGPDEMDDLDDGEPYVDSGSIVSSSGTADTLAHLGRYQILGVLGKGAMGKVYKGVDPAINRPVALKTIRLDFVTDPAEMEELKERLYREAQAAGKLSHPNIVTIYDVGSEGQLQYIAMEYLEGQTLEDMIKKRVKFNYKIISQIIIQICSALEYAHERGIVHRDIKPANIMVLSDYRIKVMDFGIARIDSNSMTKTGIAMGTPNYISPEQLLGKAVDHRADLFSLGVVMYEMLLGRRPFRGENITSLIYSILNHEPEKPSTINPQIPLLFDHIINKALCKDARGRYQKASEVVTDLFDFMESFVVKK
jgi:CHASE2 domain-containing sensor protein/predicted Ser/Thr protein kinase